MKNCCRMSGKAVGSTMSAKCLSMIVHVVLVTGEVCLWMIIDYMYMYVL